MRYVQLKDRFYLVYVKLRIHSMTLCDITIQIVMHVSTDFLVLRLFCFNMHQKGRQSYILNYMWTAANFIEGRMLWTVAINI